MNYYTKEELKLKSYEKLYEIALKEKLINIYSAHKDKKELIDLLLKYRENRYDQIIDYYDEQSFFLIQELIDTRFYEYSSQVFDIIIPRKIEIYHNTKINKEEKYEFYIEKNQDIETDFILLVGKNNYVYAILNIVIDTLYDDEKYIKYYLGKEPICRFFENYTNDDSMKLIFFSKYYKEILKNCYINQNCNFIPEEIRGYSIRLLEFSYNFPISKKTKCPIIFLENKIKSNYFEKEFAMYIRKITKKKIYIDFFEDAITAIENKDYIFTGTYIDDLNEFLSKKDEYINIYDDYLNSKYIKKQELQNIFIIHLKDEIKSYSKVNFLEYLISGIDINYDFFNKVDLSFLINYGIVKNKIANNIENSNKYLVIYSNNNNTNISTNISLYKEKDINYEISIETVVNKKNKHLTYWTLVMCLFKLLKYKISKLDYLDYNLKKLVEDIENNKYLEIKTNFLEKDKEAEKFLKTNYMDYKANVNDYYLDVKKNYYQLRFSAKKLFDEYINNKDFSMYNLLDYGIVIFKKEIDSILLLELYNFLNIFFKNYTTLSLLDKYSGINLSGFISKTDLFYSLIKEFIPGKLIKFNSELNHREYILDLINSYISDLEKGKVKFLAKYSEESKKIKVFVKNFKNEYILVLDSRKEEFNFFDRIDSISKLDVKIEYIDTGEIKKFSYSIKKEFKEIDECFVNIDQAYLNDINNNIIRFFMFFKDELEIRYIKRNDDQIFVDSEGKKFEV